MLIRVITSLVDQSIRGARPLRAPCGSAPADHPGTACVLLSSNPRFDP
jgi:hypothetical protein